MPVITVSIVTVGGNISHEIETNSATEALQFLHDYDHEGSTLNIEANFNNEDGYQFLRELEDKQSRL